MVASARSIDEIDAVQAQLAMVAKRGTMVGGAPRITVYRTHPRHLNKVVVTVVALDGRRWRSKCQT